jgi:hypothetical protein
VLIAHPNDICENTIVIFKTVLLNVLFNDIVLTSFCLYSSELNDTLISDNFFFIEITGSRIFVGSIQLNGRSVGIVRLRTKGHGVKYTAEYDKSSNVTYLTELEVWPAMCIFGNERDKVNN